MKRRKFLCGNWKMHKTLTEALTLVAELRSLINNVPVDVAVAPPFTALAGVGGALRGTSLALAAQNVHVEAAGAFTGEISPPMLNELGCRYVIVGHSERRHLFGETDELVAAKARAVVAADMIPIACVGESLPQREKRETLPVVTRQLGAILQAMSKPFGKLVVAYEPVWAIGTGKNATPGQAQEVHAHLRQMLRAEVGPLSETFQILYGGSVKPSNAAELMREPDVDGALVGGASLVAADFAAIVKGALS